MDFKYFSIVAILSFSISFSLQAEEVEKPFVDADFDGIPDIYEQPGEIYLGMPLYDWGARPKQIDIFVEIDYMDPEGSGEFDPGLVPRKEALKLMQISVREWSKQAQSAADKHYQETGERNSPLPNYPVEVHFDIGNLYHQQEGPSPENFDLGGGGLVPWAHSVGFDSKHLEIAETDPKRNYYDLYFEENRKSIFYYMLFGTARLEGGAGEALYRNVISTVTLNDLGMDEQTLIFRQATIMLHELGHNLGLQHGGVDDLNFKPNYSSVMNYRSVFLGTLSMAPPIEETRDESGYYAFFCPDNGYGRTIVLGPATSVLSFASDYSEDNEWLVREIYDEAVAKSWKGYFVNRIDNNCDGKFSRFVVQDLNHDGKIGVLINQNDWDSLYMYHHYIHPDDPGVGEVAKEFAMPPF